MKAWIRILDAPGCYERAGGEKVHTTSGSGVPHHHFVPSAGTVTTLYRELW